MSRETARRGKAAPRAKVETERLAPTVAPHTANGDGARYTRKVETTALLDGSGDGYSTHVLAGIPLSGRLITAELAQKSRRRTVRLLRLGILLSALLLLAGFFYMSPLTDPVAGQTPRALGPIPLAEVRPYGVNTFLHKEVDSWKKEKTLAQAREMGAGWIKQQFPWAEIEFRENPKDPFWDVKNNQNAWGKFDEMVNLAEQKGLRIIARIDSSPAWARNNDPAFVDKLRAAKLDPAKQPPLGDHLSDFGAFIDTFVERYRGRVSAIQVWNEPNLTGEWATGRPVNPAEYAELLKTAYTAAKNIDPSIIVLAAPLATNNETLAYAGNLNEIDYLQGLYDAGSASSFDVMAANAYGTNYPPEDPPSRDRLNFRRVELLREVMVRNGDERKAVWFNEYGWNASPPDMPDEKLRWGRVTEEQQADYTARGIQYARKEWSWAGVFTIWYMRQVGDIARTDSEYFFGLVNPEFVVSQAYRAVQSAANGESSATPGEWGPLSSPIQAGPRWQVRLSDAVPGGSYLVPTAPGDTLEIPFVGTDLKVRLAPTAAGGAPGDETVAARYYVTVDGGEQYVAEEMSRDDMGHAFIDVAGGQATEAVLARGLGDQLATTRHVARIEVVSVDPGKGASGGGRGGRGGGTYAPVRQRVDLPGIGVVVVEVHRSYLLFGVFSAALLALIGLFASFLRKSR